MPELLLLIVAVLVLVWLVFGLVGVRFQTVPEEERLVIYRLGRFNRIAGPGMIVYFGRFESIERTLNVREELFEQRVEGLSFNGLFLGYTVAFWAHTDLVAAAEGKRDQLASLAQHGDEERRKQLRSKVREAMMNTAARVEREAPASPEASLIERLVPTLPGHEAAEHLRTTLPEALGPGLRSIGMILNDDSAHPLHLKEIHLPQTLMNNFGRGMVVASLREQMPDASNELIAQLAAAIEGIQLPDARKLVIERHDGASRASANQVNGQAATSSKPLDSSSDKPAAATVHPSGDDDWKVLKRVPRKVA